MKKLLLIALLIFGCEEDTVAWKPHSGCTDSNAINYESNKTESDNSCEYSIYGYPDFESICGTDEFGNPTDNMGNGTCGLCIGERDSLFTQGSLFFQGGEFAGFKVEMSLVYPNPFNSITSFIITVVSETYLEVYILDTDYNKIDTLIQQTLSAGYYALHWDATSFPDDFYRIVADFGDVECFRNIHKKPIP